MGPMIASPLFRQSIVFIPWIHSFKNYLTIPVNFQQRTEVELNLQKKKKKIGRDT